MHVWTLYFANALRSVYSLFSALIMHVYQMRSYNPSVVAATQERIQICMDALKEVSKVWLVAKMVHTLFMSILGNKSLEERLQKAAGKRHKKRRLDAPQGSAPDSPPKTRFEDMSLGYPAGLPAPQVSFERSRPQSPAITPNHEQNVQGQSSTRTLAPMPTISPTMRHHAAPDSLFGPAQSRATTRPGSPFNVPYSMAASPPDLYLVTRNSPNISQSLWENFQPDQLFPDTAELDMAQGYGTGQTNLDPALQMAGMANPTMGAGMRMPGQAQGHLGARQQQRLGSQSSMSSGAIQADSGGQQGGWGQLSPDDTWSNSSITGQSVPTTLNVEDW